MKIYWTALRLFLWMAFLTGLAYPLLITGIAQLFMKQKADGSFVKQHDRNIGSKLIGQKFEGDHYFWPRPSAVDYNPLPSGGSNLGPTSKALIAAVEQRREKIMKSNSTEDFKIPSELLFASGSGLDPHISPLAAYFQIDRVAKARGLDPVDGVLVLERLINSMDEGSIFGFLGCPYVNVLELNIKLDAEHPLK